MPLRHLKPLVRRSGLRRAHVAAARMCCERNLLAIRGRAIADADRRPRILCYHSVGTDSWGVNDLSPARFARQVEIAFQAGYRFVPAERIAKGLGALGDLAVTFDDGLRSVLTNATPILAEFDIPYSVFVVTDWADGKHGFGDVMLDWHEIERLAGSGATIGSHSLSHPDFGRLQPAAATAELVGSAEIIASRLGIRPATFAIPFGQSANWNAACQQAARSAGYAVVYAQSEELRPTGTVPRTFITRFDSPRLFRAALDGAYDGWEEWV